VLGQEKQYFTVDEANAMIPHLEETFMRILQMRGQIKTIYDRLERAGMVLEEGGGELAEVPPGELDSEMAGEQAALEALIEAVEEELAQLHFRGALVKGLEPALVDWYARRDGHDIFLCWEFGEKEVAWWHGLEDGYTGRRPVSEL
jgi:hypothetical protein